MPIYTKYSSTGLSLRFHTIEEKEVYEAAVHEVAMQAYHREVQKYGYYAENQGKYVSSPTEFGRMDSFIMSNWYTKWLEENA